MIAPLVKLSPRQSRLFRLYTDPQNARPPATKWLAGQMKVSETRIRAMLASLRKKGVIS